MIVKTEYWQVRAEGAVRLLISSELAEKRGWTISGIGKGKKIYEITIGGS
jgi:hypothetical protein